MSSTETLISFYRDAENMAGLWNPVIRIEFTVEHGMTRT